MKTGKTGSEQTVGDACRAVIENGTATLSPDIVKRLGKIEVKPSALVCDLRCLRGGGACGREVCTSACKLTANIEMVEEEKRAEIAPCPFCGQPAKHLFGMNEHWVSCTVCGASGPMADTKQKALDVWNTRNMNHASIEMGANVSNGLQGVDDLLCALHETSTLHAYENGKTAQQLRVIIERASRNSRKAINDFLQGRKKLNPLMRDPAVELPDADISVLVRLDNEEFQFAIGEYDGACWTESGDPINCAIRSWCHMDEAAFILDAARKAVAHA